jgi:uridine kinase
MRSLLCYDVGMTIDEIATAIRQSRAKSRPVLIGIEGYGGSGKTTVAQRLAEALGDACVVSIDDFIVKEKLTVASWDDGAFDLARLEEQVLLPASQGQPVSYQRLQWETNTLSEAIAVPDVDYLIIEGISSYHPSIEHYYDYKIWVESPREVAQQRGHTRDGSNENAQYWEIWAKNDVAYQQQYHPEQRADCVFANA